MNSPRPSCLVPIRTTGDRLPILVLHGMQCDASFGMILARAMPRDQPIYAFTAPGLDGQESPLTTIDEMAVRYMDDAGMLVRGRYVLAGFCAGMAIAKQMGHMAARYGGTAERWFIIDAARITRTAAFGHIARKETQIAKLRPSRNPAAAAAFAGGEATVKAFVKALVHWDRNLSRRPYPGLVDVIATEESRASMTDATTGWQGIVPDGTAITVVGKDRHALLNDALPNVARRLFAATTM